LVAKIGVTNMVELSIILVNFNSTELTLQCIKSIKYSLHSISYELIVVDNSSINYSKEFLQEVSDTNYYYMGYNSGFGRANNVGLSLAKGKFILILNNDTILNNNAIKLALDEYKKRNISGLLTIRLLKDNNIQYSAFYKFEFLRELIHANAFYIKFCKAGKLVASSKQEGLRLLNNKTGYVPWVTGAFMLFKKAIVVDDKLFDEDFFMYSEDVDLCYRLNKIKLQHYIYTDAEIYHYDGGSAEGSVTREQQIFGSKLLYIRKNKGLVYYALFSLLFKINYYIDCFLFWKSQTTIPRLLRLQNQVLNKYFLCILFYCYKTKGNGYLKVY
jgi:GT2 family glycosyltransferase